MTSHNGQSCPGESGRVCLRETSSYTELKKWLQDNLVTLSDIGERIHRGVSTVSNWIREYRRTEDPFPKPVIDRMPATGGDTRRGRRNWYWWPEIDDWLQRHDLPKPLGPFRPLTPQQRAFLSLVDQHGPLTATEASAHLQVSHNTQVSLNTARAVLGALDRRGLITALGTQPGQRGKVYGIAPELRPSGGGLTPQQRAVLSLADQHGPLTATEASAHLQVSHDTARAVLGALDRRGLITALGTPPGQPGEVYGITPRGFYMLARERQYLGEQNT